MKILSQLKISNDFILKNRVAMSSMTRLRIKEKDLSINDLQILYYNQRSESSLIFSEMLNISADNLNRDKTPGLFQNSQIEGWLKLNNELQENQSYLFASLSHPSIFATHEFNIESQNIELKNKNLHSPSKIDNNYLNESNWEKLNKYKIDLESIKEMTDDDIRNVINDFYKSAVLAKKANFSGISLHCTSGCLLERFIKSSSNKRLDKWGDGIYLIEEILKPILTIFNRERISIKIGPVDQFGYCYDDDPKEKFENLINRISKYCKLIEIKETTDFGCFHPTIIPSMQIKNCTEYFYNTIKNNDCILISNFGTKKIEDGINLINNNKCDLVSLGTFWISNPKLISKLVNKQDLILPNNQDLYSDSSKGYIDY